MLARAPGRLRTPGFIERAAGIAVVKRAPAFGASVPIVRPGAFAEDEEEASAGA